jgi:hypothetical protein
MKLNKTVTYEQFVENIVVKRKLFTTGNVQYKGIFDFGNKTYTDTVTYHINEPEDIHYYDTFARDQLIRKLLIQINRGI